MASAARPDFRKKFSCILPRASCGRTAYRPAGRIAADAPTRLKKYQAEQEIARQKGKIERAKKFDEAVAALRLKDYTFKRLYVHLNFLNSYDIAPERRAELAELLTPVIFAGDASINEQASRALRKCASAKDADTFIKLLDSTSISMRFLAMETLGEIPATKETVKAVARQLELPNNQYNALNTLEKMGPAAEDPLLEYLPSANQSFRSLMVHTLQKMGTEKSIARLEQLVEEGKLSRVPTKLAIDSINRRLKKSN